MSVIQEMCRRWHDDLGWPSDTTTYRIVAEWSSRTADFFVCEPDGGGRPVTIKMIVRGRVIEPGAQAEALNALRRMHHGAVTSVARPPKVFAWSDSPAAVALEYIRGKDMPVMIAEALQSKHGEQLHHLLHVCGATLGAWHHNLASLGDIRTLDRTLSEALERLKEAASRQRILLESPSGRNNHIALIRRYRDFGIYNFRISASGEVTVLDPPSAAVDLDVPHRDIAWFLSTMDAAASRFISSNRRRTLLSLRQYDALRVGWSNAFIGGYQTATKQTLEAWDFKAISVFEGLFLLGRWQRSLRRMQLVSAFLYARLILRSRRRARRCGRADGHRATMGILTSR